MKSRAGQLPPRYASEKVSTVQGNYVIAVCDILGFSPLVESGQLGDVVEHALGWFRKSLHHSLHKNAFPENTPATRELERHPHVGVAWFSDTVLLYTKQDTDDSVRELLTAVGWLLFETMIHGNTRIRAGISYGEAFIDPENSIYVGKPIVEAYRLEQSQQWSGGALTESAVQRVPQMARTGRFADWWLIPYDVPLKGQPPLRTLAVNWNLGIHALGWRLLWSRESEIPSASDWATDPSICEKFMNTKAFHDANCHECGVAAEA